MCACARRVGAQVHWAHLPPALLPDAAWDGGGCWSGAAVLGPEGLPRLLYTGGGP